MRLDFEHSCCGARNRRATLDIARTQRSRAAKVRCSVAWTACCSAPRGRIHGDPVERMLDRFAMGFTATRMRASGLRHSQEH